MTMRELFQSRALKRFLRHRLAVLSLIFLLVVTGLAIFAPYVTSYSFDAQDISSKLQPASSTHWMGTDNLGRDQFSRILYGARVSLQVGVLTALFALVFGTL